MLKIFKRSKKNIRCIEKIGAILEKLKMLKYLKNMGRKCRDPEYLEKLWNIDKNHETFEIFGQKYRELEESQNYYFSRDVKIKINISKTRECKNSIKKNRDNNIDRKQGEEKSILEVFSILETMKVEAIFLFDTADSFRNKG